MPCDPSCDCCNMSLKKIEIFGDIGCKPSVKQVKVSCNSNVHWGFIDSYWQKYTAFKVAGLDLYKGQVSRGVSMCVQLASPCARIQDFCYDGGDGYCRTSFFSMDERCCPTTSTATPKLTWWKWK